MIGSFVSFFVAFGIGELGDGWILTAGPFLRSVIFHYLMQSLGFNNERAKETKSYCFSVVLVLSILLASSLGTPLVSVVMYQVYSATFSTQLLLRYPVLFCVLYSD